jgi:MFS transporter, PHS family, inorganic phosphate transporter
MLYCICELALYFGPNAWTFIIPPKIFPTPHRATCHGISAAAGKLGFLLIELILAYVRFNGHSSGSIESVAGDRTAIGLDRL